MDTDLGAYELGHRQNINCKRVNGKMSVLVNKSINILISVAAVFGLFFFGVHSVYADHFTEEGYKFVAEGLMKELKKENIYPSK